MSVNIKNKKIAIIGAGISGLILAQKLSKLADVRVFDKSRGIGGRMATRRAEGYHFDHGAQFFTAKSDGFKAFCTDMEQKGMIESWNPEYAEIMGEKICLKGQLSTTEKHFVAKPQMNSLCKYLAQDLQVNLNQRVEKLHRDNDKWVLKCGDEEFDGFDYVMLTIPSHQAVDLLPENFHYFDLVSHVKMSGCFSLMLGLKEKPNMAFEAAFVSDSILSWIAFNHSKPERPNEHALLVNANNQWAETVMEDDLDHVKKQMMQQLSNIITLDISNINYETIHRWRYANADSREGEKSLFDPALGLGICGDWLISGRVESAFLSAIDLSNKLATLDLN